MRWLAVPLGSGEGLLWFLCRPVVPQGQTPQDMRRVFCHPALVGWDLYTLQGKVLFPVWLLGKNLHWIPRHWMGWPMSTVITAAVLPKAVAMGFLDPFLSFEIRGSGRTQSPLNLDSLGA